METISTLKGFEVFFISLGGILCTYLGYRLLKIGTSRPFDIFSDMKGWKFRAANMAPGIFFAVLGTVVLCSPVITNVISILQKERFINTYATKLILDELRKKNEEILAYKLEKHVSLRGSESNIASTTGDLARTRLQKLNKAVVMTNGLRLRKEPGIRQQVIGSLLKGDIAVVKEARGQWLRVSTAEFTDGWVHRKYVNRMKDPGTPDSTRSPMVLSSNP